MSVNRGADNASGESRWGLFFLLCFFLPGLYFFFLTQLCLDAVVTVETRTGAHDRAEQREKRGLPALSLQPAGDNAPLLPRI